MSFELDLGLPECSDSWMALAFGFWLKVSLAMGVG
jgi:hypothetical protein